MSSTSSPTILITENNLKKIINTKNDTAFDNLNRLCFEIEQILIKTHNDILKKNLKKLNILFDICKKIYESREKNYILKFIKNLNEEELKFITDSLSSSKDSIVAIYKFYTHNYNDILLKGLSKYDITNGDINFLSPKINKYKYIKIPSNDDSNIKKIYFIDLIMSIYPIEIDTSKDTKIINFLKIILSNKNWNILFNYLNKPGTKGKIYESDIILGVGLGKICDFNFLNFRDTIAKEIIKEKNNNITKTSDNIKNAKNIVDLFEIYYVINYNNISTV